jgi:hypothetical protein
MHWRTAQKGAAGEGELTERLIAGKAERRDKEA